MNLWLDDERPAPEGWAWYLDIGLAKTALFAGLVDKMSLDHDLGEGKLTGYDLVKWCAETGHWSRSKPTVHSMNPVGAADMRSTIDRYWTPPAVLPSKDGA